MVGGVLIFEALSCAFLVMLSILLLPVFLTLQGRWAFYHSDQSWLSGWVGQSCIRKAVKDRLDLYIAIMKSHLGQWLGFDEKWAIWASVAHSALTINWSCVHAYTHLPSPSLFFSSLQRDPVNLPLHSRIMIGSWKVRAFQLSCKATVGEVMTFLSAVLWYRNLQ